MSDVITIGSDQASGKTDAEKQQLKDEQMRKIAEAMIKKSVHGQYQQVLKEYRKGKSLDTMIEEINNKKSNLSSNTRQFLLNFKQERVQEWLDEDTKKIN